MNKSPAFQLYVQDFLVGTMHMSAEQVGAYILLLLYQWDKGMVPTNKDKLAGIARCEVETIEFIIDKFPKGEDGLLRNKRLELIREEQIANREKRRKSGLAGNAKRWNGEKQITEIQPRPLLTEAAKEFFYIGLTRYKANISDYIKENMPEFLNLWRMKNKAIDLTKLLNQMDSDYAGYKFTDENHIQNSLKKTAKELDKPVYKGGQKEANKTTTTSAPRPFELK
jgi:uncharacterized protein YdaU (DUF1376 family)